ANFRSRVGLGNDRPLPILAAHQFKKRFFGENADVAAAPAQLLGAFQFAANPAVRQQRPASHTHNQKGSFSGNSDGRFAACFSNQTASLLTADGGKSPSEA